MTEETSDKVFTCICLFAVALLIFAGILSVERYNENRRLEKIHEYNIHFEMMGDFIDDVRELSDYLEDDEKAEISMLFSKVYHNYFDILEQGGKGNYTEGLQLCIDCWYAECQELEDKLRIIGQNACSRGCLKRNATLLSYNFGFPNYDCYCSVGCDGARGHLW